MARVKSITDKGNKLYLRPITLLLVKAHVGLNSLSEPIGGRLRNSLPNACAERAKIIYTATVKGHTPTVWCNGAWEQNNMAGTEPEQRKSDKDKPGAKSSDTARKTRQDKENEAAMLSLAEQLATPAAQTETGQSQTKTAKKRKINSSAASTRASATMTHRSPLQDLYQDPDWEPEDMSMYPSFTHFPMPFNLFPTYYPGMGDDWGYDASTNDAPAPPDDHDDPVLTTADLMDDQDDATVDNAVEDTEPEDLLMAYQARYQDKNGPSVPEKLALFVNKIWRKGRDPETFKNTMAKHPRPENLVMQMVEVNPEVLSSLGRVAKSRDAKLKSVQAGLARAMVPKFQELCRVPETEDTTKQLFGNNLQEWIKVASQGGRLGFPGCGRGCGYKTGAYSCYHPYMSMGRGFGRGRPFLGKEATVNHEPMANDYNANSNQTIDIDKYDTIVSLSPCRPQGQEPGSTPQHQGTNHRRHTCQERG